MPFIGNQPAEAYSAFQKQDFTTSATTSYTLDHPVANGNEIALFINFVRQEPTAAYTASGTSLTLTSATSGSDDMYCVYLGKAVQTVNPPSGSVGTAQLADDAVTKAKTSALMYPAFLAYRSSTQSISTNTNTKVQFDTEVFDTDNCYDNSTNYRFTPTVAGKYFVYLQTRFQVFSALSNIQTHIYKNGSNVSMFSGNDSFLPTLQTNKVIDMNGSTDYLEGFIFQNSGSSQDATGSETTTFFGAYRIGD